MVETDPVVLYGFLYCRLVPLVGGLVLVSLLLVLLTIGLVALVRPSLLLFSTVLCFPIQMRRRLLAGRPAPPAPQLELASSGKQQQQDYSPDLIPKDAGQTQFNSGFYVQTFLSIGNTNMITTKN